MIIQEGLFYLDGEGAILGPMIKREYHGGNYLFIDNETKRTYTEEGHYFVGGRTPLDLIAPLDKSTPEDWEGIIG